MPVGVWRKGNPRSLVVGTSPGAATMENSIEVPPKLRRAPPYDLAITLPGIYPKKTKTLTGRDTHTSMLVSSIIYNNQGMEAT